MRGKVTADATLGWRRIGVEVILGGGVWGVLCVEVREDA
jgi:hypothetical protein